MQAQGNKIDRLTDFAFNIPYPPITDTTLEESLSKVKMCCLLTINCIFKELKSIEWLPYTHFAWIALPFQLRSNSATLLKELCD